MSDSLLKDLKNLYCSSYYGNKIHESCNFIYTNILKNISKFGDYNILLETFIFSLTRNKSCDKQPKAIELFNILINIVEFKNIKNDTFSSMCLRNVVFDNII
jgi:hypothetical protein